MVQPTSDKSHIAMRAKNATVHPGVPDQTVKRKHCSRAQIDADNKAAEEAKTRAGLKQIADLEKKLNEEGSNDFTPKAKAMSCSRVRSKCTALLNRKHGRFGRVRALASAHVLRLTTYYHVPENFG